MVETPNLGDLHAQLAKPGLKEMATEAPLDHNAKIQARIDAFKAQQTEQVKEEEVSSETAEIKEESKEIEKKVETPEEEEEVVNLTEKPEEKEGNEEDAKEVEEEDESQTITLKVNGQEVSKTQDEVVKLAQKGLAADEKFQKASIMEKEATTKIEAAEVIVKSLKQNPLGTMEQILGPDQLQAACEQYLAKVIEWNNLPDAEKKMILAQKEAEFYKTKAAQEEQQRTTQQSNVLIEAAQKSLDEQLRSAFKARGLPDKEEFLYRALIKMDKAYNEETDSTITAQEAVTQLWEDLLAEQKILFDSTPEDEIRNRFGDTAKKIHKADLRRLKSGKASIPSKGRAPQQSKSPKTSREEKQKAYAQKRVDLPIFEED